MTHVVKLSQQGAVLLTATPTEALILDAARDAILAVGWRRTTLTDIARRAGVSRMTVYRLWPDTQSLLADLLTREWVAMEDSVASEAGLGEDGAEVGPETIATLVVATVGAIRDNELFRRIVDLDPELLLPYLLERPGRSQQHTLVRLRELIGVAADAGTMATADPDRCARAILLAAHGFLLSATTMIVPGTTVAGLDDELHSMVLRYLSR